MVILTFQRSAQLGLFGKNIKLKKKKRKKNCISAASMSR